MNQLRTILALATLCLTTICAAAAKPNVIFILTDDLGYGDLTCYRPDSDVGTPHIDSLARKGVRFTQFYAASNVCAPSRRAILTGRYPSRLGEWAEAYRTTPEDDAMNARDEPCFPLFLKQAGYVNGMFGKWNIGSVHGVSTPEAQGFDYWIGSHHNTSHFGHRNNGRPDFWENGKPAPQYAGRFADDVFVDKAIGFIKDNRDKPFFVYLALFTPHAPFQDPADPNETGRADLAVYNEPGAKSTGPPNPTDRPVAKKMLRHVDRRIGDLMDTLADLGLEENTLVIFTSDNGGERAGINQPLSGFKQQMLEGGIRVPALIQWPAKIPAGKISDQAGISMDFTRTILAATGAEPHVPDGRELDGINLLPILTGEVEEMERSLFWRRREWRPGANGENTVWAESLRHGDWKYIKEFQQAPGYGRAQMGTYNKGGYVELLFHLKDDIAEKNNLAETQPEKLAAMRGQHERWRAKIVDRHRHYRIPVADQYGTQPFARGQNPQTTKQEAKPVEATFQTAEIFSSDMILQREVPIPVWGKAPDGMEITVRFNEQTRTTTAHEGAWKVEFPAMPASAKPRVMSIQATGQNEIRFENIVVGDIWLASGQSNMEMQLRGAAGGNEAIASSANPMIRHFKVPRPDEQPQPNTNHWYESAPASIASQSAVGYFFADELQKKLGIPIGLLNCSYGGTCTETWCGPEVMARDWPEWQAWQKRVKDDPKTHPRNKVPSYLYERMVKPIIPFPIKGILWYQGEGNAGRAEEQKKLLPAMVADWRKSWGNEQLPFFFVQLARYEAANWHSFRQAQLECWRTIPHSHMAVTIDLSKEPGNHPIHPKTKAPIGHRLALAARAQAYGETSLVHSGPVVRSMAVEGANAILSFDHVGSGLTSMDGKPLRGFYLSADGKTFFPGLGRIFNDTVIVSSAEVPVPVAVRYAAEGDMGKETLNVNLGNREGLPATPFTLQTIK